MSFSSTRKQLDNDLDQSGSNSQIPPCNPTNFKCTASPYGQTLSPSKHTSSSASLPHISGCVTSTTRETTSTTTTPSSNYDKNKRKKFKGSQITEIASSENKNLTSLNKNSGRPHTLQLDNLLAKAKLCLKTLKIRDSSTWTETFRVIKDLYNAKLFKFGPQRIETQIAACIYVIAVRHAHSVGIRDVSRVLDASTKNFSECIANVRQSDPSLEHRNTVWNYLPTIVRRLKFDPSERRAIFDLTKDIIRVYRYRDITLDGGSTPCTIVAASFYAWKAVNPKANVWIPAATPSTSSNQGTINLNKRTSTTNPGTSSGPQNQTQTQNLQEFHRVHVTFKQFCDVFEIYYGQKQVICDRIMDSLKFLVYETDTNMTDLVDEVYLIENLRLILKNCLSKIPAESEPDIEQVNDTCWKDEYHEEEELYQHFDLQTDSNQTTEDEHSEEPIAFDPNVSTLHNGNSIVYLKPRTPLPMLTMEKDRIEEITPQKSACKKVSQKSNDKSTQSPTTVDRQQNKDQRIDYTRWVMTEIMRRTIDAYQKANPQDQNFHCQLLSEQESDHVSACDDLNSIPTENVDDERVVRNYKLDLTGALDLTLQSRKTVIVRQQSKPAAKILDNGEVEVDCDYDCNEALYSSETIICDD